MRWRWLAILLVATGFGVITACGEDRLSREEFSERLQGIIEEPRNLFERLAQQGRDLKPSQVLPDELKQLLNEGAEVNRQAADELEQLDPPEDAEEQTREFVTALRERAEAFEQAAGEERITLREFEPALTESGEGIDRALEALRQEGFLPEEGHDRE